jgi:hypothetical protein
LIVVIRFNLIDFSLFKAIVHWATSPGLKNAFAKLIDSIVTILDISSSCEGAGSVQFDKGSRRKSAIGNNFLISDIFDKLLKDF